MTTIETLINTNREKLENLEKRLGFTFNDKHIAISSLIHRSFSAEQSKSFIHDNEKLEFLGDAVVDLVVGHELYNRYPEMREGELSRLRAALVNEAHLATMACTLELGDFLFLGKGEDGSGGREKPSILSAAFEAVVGAMYLDGGFEAARVFLQREFQDWLQSTPEKMLLSDYKSRLQEILQERYNETPEYILEKEEGPDHDKLFTVSVRFRGVDLATAIARSKKEAEQRAAASALQEFEHQEL